MNIKAILASLVLGSSSVALAHPSVTVSAGAEASYGAPVVRDDELRSRYDDEAPVVRDHRFDDGYGAPAGRPSGIYYRDDHRWHGDRLPPVFRAVTLASQVQLGRDGRSEIWVGGQAGRFNTLRLSADGGRTTIDQVVVQFDNHEKQIVRVSRTLFGDDSLTLDLDGQHRGILRVIVYGRQGHGHWQHAGGAFSLTAA